ncbi:hypothetical protein CROQUDRAFT_87019 [Cronartium quercuum f. sp. fusiforme G11]|uniref:Uncharacterized protein n=1 Tax=Cronartium quercuum f. sp. fusiforme G11 TaxID=708437 RepID=A0A9P6TGP5_9BASI|nr:hypothetical protein CROQUDRAFT_87019 [Cronartium quercuum f. sp. fusiforme G11]
MTGSSSPRVRTEIVESLVYRTANSPNGRIYSPDLSQSIVSIDMIDDIRTDTHPDLTSQHTSLVLGFNAVARAVAAATELVDEQDPAERNVRSSYSDGIKINARALLSPILGPSLSAIRNTGDNLQMVAPEAFDSRTSNKKDNGALGSVPVKVAEHVNSSPAQTEHQSSENPANSPKKSVDRIQPPNPNLPVVGGKSNPIVPGQVLSNGEENVFSSSRKTPTPTAYHNQPNFATPSQNKTISNAPNTVKPIQSKSASVNSSKDPSNAGSSPPLKKVKPFSPIQPVPNTTIIDTGQKVLPEWQSDEENYSSNGTKPVPGDSGSMITNQTKGITNQAKVITNQTNGITNQTNGITNQTKGTAADKLADRLRYTKPAEDDKLSQSKIGPALGITAAIFLVIGVGISVTLLMLRRRRNRKTPPVAIFDWVSPPKDLHDEYYIGSDAETISSPCFGSEAPINDSLNQEDEQKRESFEKWRFSGESLKNIKWFK